MEFKENSFKLLIGKVLRYLSKRNTPQIAGCFLFGIVFIRLRMGVCLRADFAPTLDVGTHRASHQRRPGQDKSAGLGNGGIKGICTKSDNNHQNLTTPPPLKSKDYPSLHW